MLFYVLFTFSHELIMNYVSFFFFLFPVYNISHNLHLTKFIRQLYLLFIYIVSCFVSSTTHYHKCLDMNGIMTKVTLVIKDPFSSRFYLFILYRKWIELNKVQKLNDTILINLNFLNNIFSFHFSSRHSNKTW